MTDLLELAERVEKATGPDRRLDTEIAAAVDWKWPDWEEGESTARSQVEKHGLDWLAGRVKHGYASMWRNLPAYTASLDAALTLVPEGYIVGKVGERTKWELAEALANSVDRSEHQPWSAWVHVQTNDRTFRIGRRFSHHGDAASAALALCAAALRSRAT